jgi:hypothetical protein
MANNWTPRPAGFELETGAMTLSITDQSDRSCGWCWHASAEGMYGNEEIGRGGYLPTAEAAKAAAKTWARTYCERTLAGIMEG